jgi:hypothetical protein
LRADHDRVLVQQSASNDPFRFAAANRATISRVPDTWPPPGPQKRPPTLEHIRDLWQLRGITSNVTAAIWRNDFGLELRVENNGELASGEPAARR